MCGITAYIGVKFCAKLVLDSLRNLTNRGYDSVGVLLKNSCQKDLFIIKQVSDKDILAIDKIKTELQKQGNYEKSIYNVGIGHTRWATHGIKNKTNSHPHTDNTNKFYIVHNGIIDNYQKLKETLISKGFTFYSETDTEVIANLLSYYYQSYNDIVTAINYSINILTGTFGVCFFHVDFPTKLFCFKRGSPLLISITDNFALVSSEVSGFNNLTNQYIILKNNDYCVIEKTVDKIIYTCKNSYNTIKLENTIFQNTKGTFKHWTIKEIYEQTESLKRAINNGARITNEYDVKLGGLIKKEQQLKNVDNIVIIGCGTSYHAAKIAVHYFSNLCKFNFVISIDGCEFSDTNLPKYGNTAAILLSQSGETRDLFNCIETLANLNIRIIGVINVVDSLIARDVSCGVYLNAGKEIGVASTKSFTSQLVVLNMIALWFSNIQKINKISRTKYISSLRNLYLDVEKILEKYEDISSFARNINHQSLFILGKGKMFNIAEEAALKIKELSYCHAEAYSGSALKHGPFSLLEKGFPVILIINKDKHYNKMISAYEEIKCREADIFVITNDKTFNHDKKFVIDTDSIIAEILYIIPFQIIAYEMAINRDINPDYPRNLAKVVTVE